MRQFDVAEALKTQGKTEECRMIWRSQIVMGTAAFDFYMHELTKYGMNQIWKGNWPHTGAYDKMEISLSRLEDFRNLNEEDSEKMFLEYVTEKFSTVTLMDGDKIADQLKMLGLDVESIFSRAAEKPKLQEKKVIIQLKEIFLRRNRIAHQVDQRHEDAEEYPITENDVETCIEKLDEIIQLIDLEVQEKNLKRFVDVEYLCVYYDEELAGCDFVQFYTDYSRLKSTNRNLEGFIVPVYVNDTYMDETVLEIVKERLDTGKIVWLLMTDGTQKVPVICQIKRIEIYDNERIMDSEILERVPIRFQNKSTRLFLEVAEIKKSKDIYGKLISSNDETMSVKSLFDEQICRMVHGYQKKYE